MTRPWAIFAALAVAIALGDLVRWAMVLASGLPIGYGEGAVAHAGQILARGDDPYAISSPSFVSANYPPLGYVVAALGSPLGPFAGLRVANVIAALAIAGAILWRGRRDPLVGGALAASFLALFPVALWLPHARVDLIAVALTALAVTSLDAARARGALFGALGALALFAKPTAILPVALVFAYLLWRDRAAASRAAGAGLAVGAVGSALMLARSGPSGLYEHLVTNNAFGYDLRNPVALALLAILLIGGFVVMAAREGHGPMRPYLIGAAGVVLLGGHEGATANYLLDLAAAASLALATVDRGRWGPPVLTAQLVATAVLLVGPLAPPSLDAQAARLAVVADLPKDGLYYAEDSALLVAARIEPVIDDAYVWARLVELGIRADDVTPRVEGRAFHAIVSDFPLDELASAPEFARQRWPAALADAVLRNYVLDRSAPGAYRYVPRLRTRRGE